MKKIGFITSNKVLFQSLAAFIKEYPDLGFETCLILRHEQAVLDAELMRLDVAVVEISMGTVKETETILRICGGIRRNLPSCRIMLLMPPIKTEGRGAIMDAVRIKAVDDYVFYDESLEYLLAKLQYI